MIISFFFLLNPPLYRGEEKKKKEKKIQALSFIRIKKEQVPREERRDEKEKFD